MPKNDTRKSEKKNEKPTTMLFIRHGENEWTKTHKLAGRTPAVHLNNQGRKQAEALGVRLADSPLNAIYSSPLERTQETAEAIAKYHKSLVVQLHPGLLEVDYGKWTGKKIANLVKKKSWPVIQHYPSGASFPGGETMFEMQSRFVQTVNKLVTKHRGETVAIIGHADLIKSAVAHYLGVHFDLFQRIVISTASITTIVFTPMGPRVISVNDTNHNPPPPKENTDDKGA